MDGCRLALDGGMLGRLGATVRRQGLSALACLALASGCATNPPTSVASSPSGSVTTGVDCGAVGPDAAYWADERNSDLELLSEAHAGDPLDANMRPLKPDGTMARFSDASLECWRQNGNGFAALLLAFRSVGISSAFELTPNVYARMNVRTIALLKQAAEGSSCTVADPEGRAFLSCEAGLPEAQYWLAACSREGLGPCRVDMSEFRKQCARLRRSGWGYAIFLCRS